jgi:hypothetical protein
MAQSILNTIKKVIGLTEDDDSFDLDLLIHINSVFATLTQLGVGPEDGFEIEDDSALWEDFLPDRRYNFVKSFVYLEVKRLFDPPGTSFLGDAYKLQRDEYTYRISVLREGDQWTEPISL